VEHHAFFTALALGFPLFLLINEDAETNMFAKQELTRGIRMRFQPIVQVILAVILFTASVSEAAWPPTKQESLDSGIKLLGLQQKKIIDLKMVAPSPLIYVDPRGWESLLHAEKHALVRLFMDFVYGWGREQRKQILFIYLKDMTKGDTVAVGYLEDGKVEIKR
jgi:hypothetical protein